MIQEHWLFNCQIQLLNEIHENLNGIGKSVDDNDPLQPIQMPRGYGGTGRLWKKELDHLINVIDIGNERIQCVEFTGSSRKILFVSVYMPCKGPQNHILEFQECVDMLYKITQIYGTSHIIVFGGDFNEDIINTSNNQRSRYILDFMEENNFTTVDVGKTFINSSGSDCSSIDYIIFPVSFKDQLTDIAKIDNLHSLVSDHYPVRAIISIDFSKIHDKPLEQRQKTVSKVNWNRIDKNLYQQEIEKQLDNLCICNYAEIHLEKAYYDINSLIESAVSTVAPSNKITRKKPKLNVRNSDIYIMLSRKRSKRIVYGNGMVNHKTHSINS